MFLVTSPIVINVPTRGLLAVKTMHAIVQWLANLNIKRNMTSMFVNKKHRYKNKNLINSLSTQRYRRLVLVRSKFAPTKRLSPKKEEEEEKMTSKHKINFHHGYALSQLSKTKLSDVGAGH